VAFGAEPAAAPAGPVKLVVVTGGHGYDVPNFEKLFQSLAGIQTTFQTMEQFVASPVSVRDGYDVVLFYHMLMPTPQDPAKAALEHLGSTPQGVLVLHHALLAYPQWSVWTDLMGIADRKFGYHHDQKLHVNVVNTQHPITRGLASWDMIDETYTMASAGEGSEVLLTTDHPKSMKTLGWARQYKQSRVFCLESGHDNQTWADPSFREVLRRGLLWCARRT
jgi:trehalose utilization protein